MKDIIILTKNIKDGEKLKQILSNKCADLIEIKCYVKETIEDTTNIKYIFSTWNIPTISDSEVKNLFPNLKAVFYAAGTVKYFAEPLLRNGVRVFTAASANGVPVAEFTVSQIILANKGYHQAQKEYKWPIWTWGFNKARRKSELKYGNNGATVGIIGCGAIGSTIVELLRPYKLNIVVYDPFLSLERAIALGVKKVELEELFKSSDVVSNHLPDIPETRNILNFTLFSLMKPTATFINTGRGRQVVEKDLAKVMRKNKNMCALLDVTSHEPMFPWNPLYFCKNVFITPHIAGSLSYEFDRLVEYMVLAYNDVRKGKANPCEIFLDQILINA